MTFESILSRIPGTEVVIIGDVMLDEYIWGEVRRISPEAPVPVVEAQTQTYAPGGAANVAANVVSLGGVAYLGGLVGKDSAATRLKSVLTECGIQATGLASDPTRPTTRKTRVIAHSHQIVRVDYEEKRPLPEPQARTLLRWVGKRLATAGACVVSDYSKGVATPDFAQRVIASARRRGKPVVVDPKGADYARYKGATVITPNLHELEIAVGMEARDELSLRGAAQSLMQLLPGTTVLVTRGAQGMSLFIPGRAPVHIPTFARNVYDVTGAGDTVVSALALALATGAELESAAHLANRAAGIVVGKLGTAHVTSEELQRDCAL
jgi:D-beta-D-heptose 7-phosphate kinase/D-beta-D-heptose 1-phosphate adenosyltransferase